MKLQEHGGGREREREGSASKMYEAEEMKEGPGEESGHSQSQSLTQSSSIFVLLDFTNHFLHIHFMIECSEVSSVLDPTTHTHTHTHT